MIGMTLGTIVMAAVGGVINAYVLLPAYSAAFGIPVDGLIEMGAAVNRAITSLPTFCLLRLFLLIWSRGCSFCHYSVII